MTPAGSPESSSTAIGELRFFLATVAALDGTARHNAALLGVLPAGARYPGGRASAIREHGRLFPRAPRPADHLCGSIGRCYHNAHAEAVADPSLAYVEGYAVDNPLLDNPVDHAWCVNPVSQALEVTWTGGTFYLGIPFDTGFVTDLAVQRRSEDTPQVLTSLDYDDRHLWIDGFPPDAIRDDIGLTPRWPDAPAAQRPGRIRPSRQSR